MKHASISVFVPHLACPNHCVFCNQNRISGATEPEPIQHIQTFLKTALQRLPAHSFDEVDIAFFGGSFTGIEEHKMRAYLAAAAQARTQDPRITGIRLSTRPDYISPRILQILNEYGVTTIELGAQSLSDVILKNCGRGHTVRDVEQAAEWIRSNDTQLVLQIMPGLPGDTDQTILQTAQRTIQLAPDGVRIYPCVVLKDTPLQTMWEKGIYQPLTTEHAVALCAQMVPMFLQNHIKVLRTGLHASSISSDDSVLAGPFHPAFGELVQQKIYLNRLLADFQKQPPVADEILYVGRGCTSKMIGNKKGNLQYLHERYPYHFTVKEKSTLEEFEIERKRT